MPGRERTKTNCVKLVHEMRMAFHEFGRRRVADGTFNLHTDFGLLRRDELREAVVDPGRFTDELRDREALLHEVAALQEPFLFAGRRPDMSSYPRRDCGRDHAGGRRASAVHGVPGCPGIAKGIARVDHRLARPDRRSQPGDILVAPITDPSWTPLFVPAAGVVVDVGAPLSHAIIVSRELGIPCVVSATDATKRIPDGALVEVNGDTGVVTVLSLP